jgi:hypothetical protein
MNNEPIEVLTEYIKIGNEVLATHMPNSPGVIGFPTLNSGLFQGWKARCLAFLRNVPGSEHTYTKQFESEVKEPYRSHASAGIHILEAVKSDLIDGRLFAENAPFDVLTTVSMLAERFHIVARQLRRRHNDRDTLKVTDEYDVQDLLHALLLLYFEDVRAEEWTPSYAGGSSRMDFLLKSEQAVIEVKKTRESLTSSTLGAELLVDIARYQAHSDCGVLLCFVYDPEGLLPNPRGIEKDLNREAPFPVRVLIRP